MPVKAFNAVFSKFGRLASEEVVLDLIWNKCLPTRVVIWSRGLSYACTRQALSRICRYTRSLMKLFQT